MATFAELKRYKIRKYFFSRAEADGIVEIINKQKALPHDEYYNMTEDESILFFRYYMSLAPAART